MENLPEDISKRIQNEAISADKLNVVLYSDNNNNIFKLLFHAWSYSPRKQISIRKVCDDEWGYKVNISAEEVLQIFISPPYIDDGYDDENEQMWVVFYRGQQQPEKVLDIVQDPPLSVEHYLKVKFSSWIDMFSMHLFESGISREEALQNVVHYAYHMLHGTD